jgi:hypothetical protein
LAALNPKTRSSIIAGLSPELVSEFQQGFPPDWHQVLMDYVRKWKMERVVGIMRGPLPGEASEVGELRHELITKSQAQYQAKGEEATSNGNNIAFVELISRPTRKSSQVF